MPKRGRPSRYKIASRRGVEENLRNPDRWVYAKSLRDAGHSLQTVADVLGVSRERVRQKLGKGHMASMADPIRLMRAVRDPSITSYIGAGKAVGIDNGQATDCIAALGLRPAVDRLFRWRREAVHRIKFSRIIQAEAKRLGRTPTWTEIGKAAHVKYPAQYLQRYFGPLAKLWEYVGLTPRPLGGAGHTRAPDPTTCRRGHPKKQTSKGQWWCPTCRKDWENRTERTSHQRRPPDWMILG